MPAEPKSIVKRDSTDLISRSLRGNGSSNVARRTFGGARLSCPFGGMRLSRPIRRGMLVMPAKPKWIIQPDAADLTSRSLRGVDLRGGF